MAIRCCLTLQCLCQPQRVKRVLLRNLLELHSRLKLLLELRAYLYLYLAK